MVAHKGRKNRSVKEMLLESTSSQPDSQIMAKSAEEMEGIEGAEAPVSRAFLESLFASLREDPSAMKQDLSADLREV